MHEVTRILSAIEQGDPRAAEQRLQMVSSLLHDFRSTRMMVFVESVPPAPCGSARSRLDPHLARGARR
jgi:hypothetical protein